MKKIIYCRDASSQRKFNLPYLIVDTSKIHDVYKSDIAIVIFEDKFLDKRGNLATANLEDKICFVHFSKENRNNYKIVKKFGFFDYFTDEDRRDEIRFKLRKADKILKYKSKIDVLKTQVDSKNKKIEKLILIDPLTGCYNWRYFLQRGQQELTRARTQEYGLSFIISDIDYFRQINEVYSVKVADVVIKELIDIFKKHLRREDIIARWREDEFFIILPYVSLSDAVKVSRRIKEEVYLHRFNYKKLNVNIKISMGVVSYPEDIVSSIRDVINRLNKCLILAKRQGGNNIVVHSQPQLVKDLKETKKLSLEELKDKVDKLNILSTRDILEIIYGFARAIEAKDFYTGKHLENTAEIVEQIAKELKLPEGEIENIKPAAVLHDLGKVGVDENILSKNGQLTPEERKIVETHPAIGAEILRGIHVLRGIIPAILYHHERYDGTGYPLGLKGEEIPLSARIVAIADVYQALISDRPYRKSYTKAKALEIIKNEAGKQFDPEIVKVFLRVIKHIK